MAITVFGRGYPLSAVATDSAINVAFAGTAILDIDSTGLSAGTLRASSLSATSLSGAVRSSSICAVSLCATTLCAVNLSGTGVSGTTMYATTLCAINLSGTGVSGTTLSGTTVYTPKISGNDSVSAGQISLAFIAAGAGKHMSAYSLEGFDSSISADILLSAYYNGVGYYIPCFSGYAKEA